MNSNEHFSFIILTFNEELNLNRLLNSIAPLNANTFVVDSGSTDNTLHICENYNIRVKQHSFKNHPEQWDFALKNIPILTPWTICLDADQSLSPDLLLTLTNFEDKDHQNIVGIYFNRKYYFKGTWIKHGGYFPMYMLKMFRTGVGYSDLLEKMDHRFQVDGKTAIWKKGYLIEENLKENQIDFWSQKHLRYAALLDGQPFKQPNNKIDLKYLADLYYSPNHRNAFLKTIWWSLPKYVRPLLYLIYRLMIRKGFMDGKTGIIFHFLQAFWFRLIVDIQIDEKSLPRSEKQQSQYFKFLISFPTLTFIFYSLWLLIIGITTPGGIYIEWVHRHLDIIGYLRIGLINTAAYLLTVFNYQFEVHQYGISVLGHSGFRLVYSCLGYGIMSCFIAFVITYPRIRGNRYILLITGLLFIQLINTSRLTLIAIFYKSTFDTDVINHHTIFNILAMALIAGYAYLWINKTNYD